jgi:HD-like signal output (HDOD) protein/CheY-like chemotaxis protein
MRRILFVDDEVNVLDGLRDLLRKQRKQWEMVFALGGQAALAELEKAPFDVVVSDMRMPHIDGAQLLTAVREHYPATARIILSGHAERESVVRALPVAHQFLSKPCDGNLLRIVVDRACELQRLLQNEGIRRIIGKLDRLPSVPHTYWELTRAVSFADTQLDDIAQIVEQDPAMVAKLLQLVNSAYFGLPRVISSVPQAVSYLGTDLLRALALTVHAFTVVPVLARQGFSIETLQRHSLAVARFCRSCFTDSRRGGEVFTAALVHDIGKLIFAYGIPDMFSKVVAERRVSGRPWYQIEAELLGVTHAEVGAYLLGVWGLPIGIVEAVAFHHNPGVVGAGDVEALAWVHLGDALVDAARPDWKGKLEDKLDMEFLARAGLAHQVDALAHKARELAAKAGTE